MSFIFQFHKGTIKTDLFTGVLPTPQLFQFHKGTIKTCLLVACKVACKDFNSIKVQLKQANTERIKQLKANFNSIKVQLKHTNLTGENTTTIFQFHKGTIKTLPLMLTTFHLIQISIP